MDKRQEENLDIETGLERALKYSLQEGHESPNPLLPVNVREGDVGHLSLAPLLNAALLRFLKCQDAPDPAVQSYSIRQGLVGQYVSKLNQ